MKWKVLRFLGICCNFASVMMRLNKTEQILRKFKTYSVSDQLEFTTYCTILHWLQTFTFRLSITLSWWWPRHQICNAFWLTAVFFAERLLFFSKYTSPTDLELYIEDHHTKLNKKISLQAVRTSFRNIIISKADNFILCSLVHSIGISILNMSYEFLLSFLKGWISVVEIIEELTIAHIINLTR